MLLENKIIISESNFRATTKHLKGDLFLYHKVGEEQFKTSNNITYYLALRYNNKLYDIGSRATRQWKSDFSFENAFNEVLEKLNNVKKEGVVFSGSSLDYIKDYFIKGIEKGGWLSIWLLDIIKDYDIKYNTNYYTKALLNRQVIKEENERRAKQRQQENETRQARIEEEKAKEQALKDKENFCNGFIDNLQPMQKQRTANVLNKLFRYDGVVMSRKDNVLTKLRKGRTPDLKQFYNDKGITYMLKEPYNNTYIYEEITKTEYDYALYLLNNLGLENAKLSSEV